MPELIITIVLGVIGFVVVAAGLAAAASRFYRKVGPEEALVRSGGGELKVATGRGNVGSSTCASRRTDGPYAEAN